MKTAIGASGWWVLRRGRALVSALLLALSVFVISACNPYPEDYIGTWVGLDERRPVTVMYTYRITQTRNDHFSVRITQSYYASENGMMLVWKSSKPRYFNATYDSSADGCLKGTFGLLCYDIHTSQLKAGHMMMVRRAKSTALKLKTAALNSAKQIYPNIPAVD